MTGREVVVSLFNRSGMTNEECAAKLGISTKALWDRFNTKKAKDMSVSVLSGMVRLFGYQVAVVRYDAKLPKGSYKVD